MARVLAPLLAVLFLIGVCCGQGVGELLEDFTLEIELPSEQVPEDLELRAYVVFGSDLDMVERFVLDSLMSGGLSTQSQAFVLENGSKQEKDVSTTKELLADNATRLESLVEGASVVILVGDREDNALTDEVYSRGLILNESSKYLGQLVVGKGRLDDDSSVVVFYHEERGLERGAADSSPLKAVMPVEYIPLAATGIGFLLLSFFNVFQEMIESFIEDFGKKKAVFRKKGNEYSAVLLASLILGLSITWTFAGPSMEFFDLLFLNSGICFLAVVSHELSHRVVGRILGVELEYRFWLRGSAITLLTAFLGNSFGVPGFLMEKENTLRGWRLGLCKLAGPLLSLGVVAVFAFLYLENPLVVYQMTFSTASILAMAEVLPTKKMDGGDIRDWSRIIWTLLFASVTAAYMVVNFLG